MIFVDMHAFVSDVSILSCFPCNLLYPLILNLCILSKLIVVSLPPSPYLPPWLSGLMLSLSRSAMSLAG